MVRVSSPAKLRPWSELTAQNGDGGGSYVGDLTAHTCCKRHRVNLDLWRDKPQANNATPLNFRCRCFSVVSFGSCGVL